MVLVLMLVVLNLLLLLLLLLLLESKVPCLRLGFSESEGPGFGLGLRKRVHRGFGGRYGCGYNGSLLLLLLLHLLHLLVLEKLLLQSRGLHVVVAHHHHLILLVLLKYRKVQSISRGRRHILRGHSHCTSPMHAVHKLLMIIPNNLRRCSTVQSLNRAHHASTYVNGLGGG
ncbi:hypothetical protein BC829DRAFT_387898 [Chytridium lagenaria]|nr:hypothetical protein BC829DRAFT_387898 [Chytridium lagenaria]